MARIFISSTTEDLRDHRHAVVTILEQLGHDPILLENLAADSTKAPLERSRELIDSCELFIGILAWRSENRRDVASRQSIAASELLG